MTLEIKKLSKDYIQPNGDSIQVIRDLDLSVHKGKKVAIMGPSGSGKTTLLSLLAGLDVPSQGSIAINENQLNQMTENELTRFRAQHLGIVFQRFHLISYLNAFENVALPLEILGIAEAEQMAKQALELVGLDHRMEHLPSQLSGGECQRVAIARAFVTKPSLLLADEPSGSLDEHTSVKVMQLLFDLVDQMKTTLVLVTHNPSLAKKCDELYELSDGQLLKSI